MVELDNIIYQVGKNGANYMDRKKPMLSTDDQIKHLISKGVKFEKISVEDAAIYLRENNIILN